MANAAPAKPRGRIARTIERVRRPNREHVEKLKERVPFWFVALILFAFAALQIVLNPFGFSDLTQRYAQDVSNLLITGPYLYPTTGREQVTVARIDEETLHNLQMPWPWSYGQHARALDTILSYKPKAVIIDFLFVDPRNDDTLKDLVEEIARFRRDHVPIYFEGGTELPFGEAPLLPALAKTGVPILDPSIAVYDGVVRQYQTSGACFGIDGKMPGTCPSLALRVYKDLYPDYPLEPLRGMMELVWGTRTAPLNIKLNHDATTGKPMACARDDGFARRIYNAFFDKQTAMANCPYTTVIPVEALLDGLEDQDVDNAIRGHVVFYGGSLEGAQDKSYTPVNKLQANVFVHAMAMDNLITYRGKPYQNVMTLFGTTFSNEPAQVLAIIPVILILSFMHMRRIRARRRVGHVERSAFAEWFLDKGVENLWHWLAFFLALGIGLLLAMSAGLSVANWVEDVFISVELAAMLLIGVPDSFWGYLHHVAGGDPDSGGLKEKTP